MSIEFFKGNDEKVVYTDLTKNKQSDLKFQMSENPILHVTVITLFPEIFPGPLGVSLIGKALTNNLWKMTVVPLRKYGNGAHNSVDDTCYGGGAGMLIRPDVVDRAMQDIIPKLNAPHLIYMTPRGSVLKQSHMQKLSLSREIIILCGRYEGVDERVLRWWNFQEISMGDFVLCGGELPAMMLIEGCVRLLPGVVGNTHSLIMESFQDDLLEHPQYTKPSVWNGISVPEVLISGHHQKISQWKASQSNECTKTLRKDLWNVSQNKEKPII